MLKSVSICAALLLAAAVFTNSAEAGPRGFGGHGMGMGKTMGMGPVRTMGVGRTIGMGPVRTMGVGRTIGMGPGRVAWANRGNWTGNRWAGNWHPGHFRRGGFWPWWGVGAGVALAATAWPYYGYGYDSCVQWVPDYGWVNVCGYPYGGYGYGGYGYY